MEIKKELAEQIQARLKEFRKKRTWARALKVVKTLGKKDTRESSDHTTVSYKYAQQCARTTLSISSCNYVYGGRYMSVLVDGKMVLDAEECYPDSSACKEHPLQVIKCGKQLIYVKFYNPGKWEELLNLKFLRGVKKEQETRKQANHKKEREQEEKSRPLTREEQELAEKFGIER
jgi:hypothetical protein